VIPPYLTFAQALQRGFVPRLESRAYLDWVKRQKCVCCGQPADDPHHPISVGFGGKATKVPDWWAIPLTRQCHDELHRSPSEWEGRHGPQLQHALLTLTQAIHEGKLKW
jgi:hypothetical protein